MILKSHNQIDSITQTNMGYGSYLTSSNLHLSIKKENPMNSGLATDPYGTKKMNISGV